MPKKKKDGNEGMPEETLDEIIAEDTDVTIGDTENDKTYADNNKEESKESALIAELNCERDKYIRLAAEYDNYRKRSQKEREALFTEVKAETILQLLPVYDNLERALKQKCEDEAFYTGVKMTMNQMLDIFSKMGMTMIPALGEAFDPEIHNAVMHEENENVGENVVVEEFQKGFKMGEKVIRFSVVKVAN